MGASVAYVGIMDERLWLYSPPKEGGGEVEREGETFEEARKTQIPPYLCPPLAKGMKRQGFKERANPTKLQEFLN